VTLPFANRQKFFEFLHGENGEIMKSFGHCRSHHFRHDEDCKKFLAIFPLFAGRQNLSKFDDGNGDDAPIFCVIC
jgi:hypothetical protein